MLGHCRAKKVNDNGFNRPVSWLNRRSEELQ